MRILATSVLVGLTTLGAAAQADASRPRLVVGIVVDQLRTDYIEYLQNYFGERGFRTLLQEGAYIPDVDFRVPVKDATSATAMLMTGAYPSQTGVPSASVIDISQPGAPSRLPLVSTQSASITNDSFTPEGLRLSTLADELVIDAGGNASVYSVALDPQQAVILAGHAGKGAFWINNTSGNWATTSYYGALPGALSARNLRQPLSQRIDTMVWRPSAALAKVPCLPERKRSVPFKYTFSRRDRDVYKRYSTTPLANAEVTDVAIELIGNLGLGSKPGETDVLNIAYTLAPPAVTTDDAGRAELTDSYLRLDSQLGRLFDAIDRRVGRGNSVIWLTSTGYFDDCLPEDSRYRLSGGEFSTRRARSLLNSYLSAKFGSGSYVAAIRDGQIWFDRPAIEAMHLDSESVIADAREFLVKMSGIDDAHTLNEILSPRNADDEALRLALDPRNCGDIIVDFTPGWTISYDEQTPPVQKTVRLNAVMTPAFVLAPDIAARKIDTPVEAAALAPTVAGALHIRSPNGARLRPVQLR
ncbi:MAG: alkaline phosphatase family protein [Muribaculaceae bacterium]|nr:alkaline phosphatase family protein [Muribaculaceae bacterium]